MSGAFQGGEGKTVVVGHRGGRGEGWPAENTLPAFERAVSEGALAVELDTRTCATGEAVVFHDADLTRMTDGADSRKIAQLSMKELVRVPLTGGARIPTLAEVLDWAATRVALNVELKRDVPSRPKLAAAVASHVRSTAAEVLVSSFDPELLAAVRAVAPRTRRAFLTHPDGEPKYPALALYAVHFASHQATREHVADAKKRGLKVGVWTINEATQAKSLAALGVDWLISDAPGNVRAALK